MCLHKLHSIADTAVPLSELLLNIFCFRANPIVQPHNISQETPGHSQSATNISPEVYNGEVATAASDMYDLGLLLARYVHVHACMYVGVRVCWWAVFPHHRSTLANR